MGKLQREIYSDNSTFVENLRDSWAGIGPLAAPLGEIIMTNGAGGVAGRGLSGAPPAGFRHFSEIGHTLEAQIAGADVLVRIHTHWN